MFDAITMCFMLNVGPALWRSFNVKSITSERIVCFARVEAAQGPKKRKANESQRSGDGLQREALGFGSVRTFVSGPRPLGHFHFTEKLTRVHCAVLILFLYLISITVKKAPFAGGIL